MKICSTKHKEKKPFELPNCNTIEDFKREWCNQGGTIVYENKELGSMEIKNKEGKKIFCIVLDDMIFPFSFGD